MPESSPESRPPAGAPAPGEPLPAAPETEAERGRGAATNEVTPVVIRGVIRDLLQSHEQQRKQGPGAFLVGLRAGLLGVAFRWLLVLGDAFRDNLIAFGHRHPLWGWCLPVAFGAIGAGIAVWLVRRYAPEASGSGIPHLEAVLHHMH